MFRHEPVINNQENLQKLHTSLQYISHCTNLLYTSSLLYFKRTLYLLFFSYSPCPHTSHTSYLGLMGLQSWICSNLIVFTTCCHFWILSLPPFPPHCFITCRCSIPLTPPMLLMILVPCKHLLLTCPVCEFSLEKSFASLSSDLFLPFFTLLLFYLSCSLSCQCLLPFLLTSSPFFSPSQRLLLVCSFTNLFCLHRSTFEIDVLCSFLLEVWKALLVNILLFRHKHFFVNFVGIAHYNYHGIHDSRVDCERVSFQDLLG